MEKRDFDKLVQQLNNIMQFEMNANNFQFNGGLPEEDKNYSEFTKSIKKSSDDIEANLKALKADDYRNLDIVKKSLENIEQNLNQYIQSVKDVGDRSVEFSDGKSMESHIRRVKSAISQINNIQTKATIQEKTMQHHNSRISIGFSGSDLSGYKNSMYQSPREKHIHKTTAGVDQDISDYNNAAGSNFKLHLVDSKLSPNSDSRSAARATAYIGKNAAKSSKNGLFYDTETLYGKDDGAFCLSEIGFKYGGEKITFLARLSDSAVKRTRELLGELSTFTDPVERQNAVRKLRESRNIDLISLQRLMGDYDIGGFKTITVTMGGKQVKMLADLDGNINGREIVADKLTDSDIAKIYHNLDILSGPNCKLPSQEEIAAAYVEFVNGASIDLGGGKNPLMLDSKANMFTYNGTSFDSDVIAKVLRLSPSQTHKNLSQIWAKKVDEIHIDIASLVKILGDDFIKDGKFLISRTQGDVASLLTPKQKKEILSRGGKLHTSGTDIDILDALTDALFKSEKFRKKVEEYNRSIDKSGNTIKFDSKNNQKYLITAKKSYISNSSDEFYYKDEKGSRVYADNNKKATSHHDIKNYKNYNDFDDFLIYKNGLYVMESPRYVNGQYVVQLEDQLDSGKKIQIVAPTLSSLETKLAGFMGDATAFLGDVEKHNEQMVHSIYQSLSDAGASLQRARQILIGKNNGKQLLARYNTLHEWFEKNNGKISASERGKIQQELSVINYLANAVDQLENSNYSVANKEILYHRIANDLFEFDSQADYLVKSRLAISKNRPSSATGQNYATNALNLVDELYAEGMISRNDHKRLTESILGLYTNKVNGDPSSKIQRQIISTIKKHNPSLYDEKKKLDYAELQVKKSIQSGIKSIASKYESDLPVSFSLIGNDADFLKSVDTQIKGIAGTNDKKVKLQQMRNAVHNTGANSVKAILNTIPGRLKGSDHDINQLIEKDYSLNNALTALIKTFQDDTISVQVNYESNSGEMRIDIFNNADIHYDENARFSFIIPVYNGGTGRFHNQSVADSLVAYNNGNGVRIGDSFTQAGIAACEYLANHKSQVKNALMMGSGSQSYLLNKINGIMNGILHHTSSTSPVGYSKEVSDSLLAGGANAESKFMKTHMLQIGAFNESLANRILSQGDKSVNPYDRDRVAGLLNQYFIISSTGGTFGRNFLNKTLKNQLGKYNIGVTDQLLDTIEASYAPINRAFRIDVNPSSEENILSGSYRTFGGTDTFSFGAYTSPAGRAPTQAEVQYLATAIKGSVSDYAKGHNTNIVRRNVLWTSEHYDKVIAPMLNTEDGKSSSIMEDLNHAVYHSLNVSQSDLNAAISYMRGTKYGSLFEHSLNPSVTGKGEMGVAFKGLFETLTSHRSVTQEISLSDIKSLAGKNEKIMSYFAGFAKDGVLDDVGLLTNLGNIIKTTHDKELKQELKSMFFGDANIADDAIGITMIQNVGRNKFKVVSDQIINAREGIKIAGTTFKGNMTELSNIKYGSEAAHTLVGTILALQNGITPDQLRAGEDISNYIDIAKNLNVSYLKGGYKADDERYAPWDNSSYLHSVIDYALATGHELGKIVEILNTKAAEAGVTNAFDLNEENEFITSNLSARDVWNLMHQFGDLSGYVSLVAKDIFDPDGKKNLDFLLKALKTTRAGTLNLFSEYAYFHENERAFKVGQKDREMMLRAMNFSGTSREHGLAILDAFVPKNKHQKLTNALVNSISNVIKQSEENGSVVYNANSTSGDVYIVSNGLNVGKENTIDIRDLADLISYSAKSGKKEIRNFMAKIWEGGHFKDDQDFGTVYLDVFSNFGNLVINSNDGSPSRKYSRIAISAINPKLIDEKYDPFMLDAFVAIRRLFTLASSPDTNPDEMIEGIKDYYLTSNNMISKHGSLLEHQVNQFVKNSAFKKASLGFEEMGLTGTKGNAVFDNAAFLHPEALKKILKFQDALQDYDSDYRHDFNENYKRLTHMAKDFGIKLSIINPLNEKLDRDALIAAEDEIVAKIINHVTITDIDKEGHVKFQDGSTTDLSDLYNHHFLDFILRRYPTIDQEALNRVRLFAFSGMQSEEEAFAGYGVYGGIANGDFDGDGFQFLHAGGIEFSDDLKKEWENWRHYNDARSSYRAIVERIDGELEAAEKALAQANVSSITDWAKLSAEEKDQLWHDETQRRSLLSLITKANKQGVGTFSDVGTAVRNLFTEMYKNDMINSDGGRAHAAVQTLVNHFLHFFEQETISAKKVQANDVNDETLLGYATGVIEMSDVINKITRGEGDYQENLESLKQHMVTLGYLKGDNLIMSNNVSKGAVADLMTNFGWFITGGSYDKNDILTAVRNKYIDDDGHIRYKAIEDDFKKSIGGIDLLQGMADSEKNKFLNLLIVDPLTIDPAELPKIGITWDQYMQALALSDADVAQFAKDNPQYEGLINTFSAYQVIQFKNNQVKSQWLEENLDYILGSTRRLKGGNQVNTTNQGAFDSMFQYVAQAFLSSIENAIRNFANVGINAPRNSANHIYTANDSNFDLGRQLTSSGFASILLGKNGYADDTLKRLEDYLYNDQNDPSQWRQNVFGNVAGTAPDRLWDQLLSTKYGTLVHSAMEKNGVQEIQADISKMAKAFGLSADTLTKDIESKARVAQNVMNTTFAGYKNIGSEIGVGLTGQIDKLGSRSLLATIDDLRYDSNKNQLLINDWKNLKGNIDESVLLQTNYMRYIFGTQLDEIAKSRTKNATTGQLETLKAQDLSKYFDFGINDKGEKILPGQDFLDAIDKITAEIYNSQGAKRGADYINLSAMNLRKGENSVQAYKINALNDEPMRQFIALAMTNNQLDPQTKYRMASAAIQYAGEKQWVNGVSDMEILDQYYQQLLTHMATNGGDKSGFVFNPSNVSGYAGHEDYVNNFVAQHEKAAFVNDSIFKESPEIISKALKAERDYGDFLNHQGSVSGNGRNDYNKAVNESLVDIYEDEDKALLKKEKITRDLNKAEQSGNLKQMLRLKEELDAINKLIEAYESLNKQISEKAEAELGTSRQENNDLKNAKQSKTQQRKDIVDDDSKRAVGFAEEKARERVQELSENRKFYENQSQYTTGYTKRIAEKSLKEIDGELKRIEKAYGITPDTAGESNFTEDSSSAVYQKGIKEYTEAKKKSYQLAAMKDRLDRIGTEEQRAYINKQIELNNALLNNSPISQEDKNEINQEIDINRTLAGEKKMGAASKIGQLLKGGFNQFLQYTVVLGGIRKITSALAQVIPLTQQLNAVMTNLRIVTGSTQESTKSLMKTYSDMAKELGTTTSAIAASGNDWLRQGFSIAETNQLIEQSIKLSRLGMIDGGKATQYLTSTLKGFRMEAFEASNIVDKLTTLDLNYATSAGAIAEAMSRTAAVAKAAGMDLDSTAAALTTIMDITQQDPGSTGTALRSILSRYGSINVSSYKASLTGEDTEGINNIEKVLKTIGITIRQSGGEMKDFNDVLDELASKWDNLNDVEQNAISTAMAGTRQRNAFVTLLENYDQYQKAIEISQNSEGQAALKYQAYMDSIEYSLQRLKASWEELTMKLDLKDTMKSIIDTTSWVVEHLPAVLDKIIQVLTMYRVTKAAGKGDLTGPGSLMGQWSKTGKVLFGEDSEGRSGVNRMLHWRENTIRSAVAKGMADATGNDTNKAQDGSPSQKNIQNKTSNQDNTSAPKSKRALTVIGTFKNAKNLINERYNEYVRVKNAPENLKIKQESLELTKIRLEHLKQTDPKNRNKIRMVEEEVLGAEKALEKTKQDYAAYQSLRDSALKRDEELARIQAQRNAHISQSFATGAIAAATTAVSAAMAGNNSEMGNVFAAYDRKRQNKYGNAKGGAALQDLETTAGDRALSAGVQGVGMGAAATVGSLVGGPLGMAITAIGSLASSLGGDAIATGLKELIHGDELNRKERVMAANEIIKTINSTKDTLNDSIKLAATQYGHYTLEDENKAAEIEQTYKKQLSNGLWFTDSQGNKWSQADLFVRELENQGLNYKSSGDNQSTALIALSQIGNMSKDAGKIIQAFAAASTILETAASKAAHEEEIWELRENLGSDESIKAAQYNTLINEGRFEEAKDLANKYQNKYKKDISSGLAQRRANQAKLESFREEEIQGDMISAFYRSGASAMSNLDIATADRDRVIYDIAYSWAKENADDNVFDAVGNITADAYRRINSYIKALDNFKPLFGSDQKFLGEITGSTATNRRKQLLERAQNAGFNGTFEDLVKNYTTEGFISQWFNTKDVTEIAKIMDEIGSLDTSKITKFAHALGMTTDELIASGEKFAVLSESDLSDSANNLSEKFKAMSQVISDLVSGNGILSTSSINNIISTSPYLLYDTAVGEGNSESSGLSMNNILKNIFSLYAGKNSPGLQAYGQARATEIASDANIWQIFKSQYKDHWQSLGFNNPEEIDKLNNEKTFDSVSSFFTKNEAAMKVWSETISQFIGIPDNFQQVISNLIQYQNQLYDNEISNLKSIQDNLSKNNNEREKELKLIKAQQALEEAYKDKKKVYRAGIGFTYEANAEAVKSAQEQVDAARKEIDSQNLEYEISLIEQQKNLLGNISNENNLDYLAKFTDDFKEIFNSESENTLFNNIITDFQPKTILKDLEQIVENTSKQYGNVKDEQKQSMLQEGVKATEDLFAAEAAFKLNPEDQKTRDNYSSAINNYNNTLDKMTEVGVSSNEFKSALQNSSVNEVSKYGTYSDLMYKAEHSPESLTDTEKEWLSTNAKSIDHNMNVYGHVSSIESKQEMEDKESLNYNMRYFVPGHRSSNLADDISGMTLSVSSSDQIRDISGWSYPVRAYYDNEWHWESNLQDLQALPELAVVIPHGMSDQVAYKKNGEFKIPYNWMFLQSGDAYSEQWLNNLDADARDLFEAWPSSGYASGSYDTGINSRINELGTEIIVTPQGTLTSLPSHSGIVPADLTRNLFNLGEVAPNLIRRFESNVLYNSNAGHTEDNSTNIDAIYASFETHDGFDANQFLVNLRQVVNNTTNNR